MQKLNIFRNLLGLFILSAPFSTKALTRLAATAHDINRKIIVEFAAEY